MYEGATVALAIGWVYFFAAWIGVIMIGVAVGLFVRWLDKHWF